MNKLTYIADGKSPSKNKKPKSSAKMRGSKSPAKMRGAKSPAKRKRSKSPAKRKRSKSPAKMRGSKSPAKMRGSKSPVKRKRSKPLSITTRNTRVVNPVRRYFSHGKRSIEFGNSFNNLNDKEMVVDMIKHAPAGTHNTVATPSPITMVQKAKVKEIETIRKNTIAKALSILNSGENQRTKQFDRPVLYPSVTKRGLFSRSQRGDYAPSIGSRHVNFSPSMLSPRTFPRTSPRTAPKTAPRTFPRTDQVTSPWTSPKTAPRTSPKTAPRTFPRTDQVTSPWTSSRTAPTRRTMFDTPSVEIPCSTKLMSDEDRLKITKWFSSFDNGMVTDEDINEFVRHSKLSKEKVNILLYKLGAQKSKVSKSDICSVFYSHLNAMVDREATNSDIESAFQMSPLTIALYDKAIDKDQYLAKILNKMGDKKFSYFRCPEDYIAVLGAQVHAINPDLTDAYKYRQEIYEKHKMNQKLTCHVHISPITSFVASYIKGIPDPSPDVAPSIKDYLSKGTNEEMIIIRNAYSDVAQSFFFGGINEGSLALRKYLNIELAHPETPSLDIGLESDKLAVFEKLKLLNSYVTNFVIDCRILAKDNLISESLARRMVDTCKYSSCLPKSIIDCLFTNTINYLGIRTTKEAAYQVDEPQTLWFLFYASNSEAQDLFMKIANEETESQIIGFREVYDARGWTNLSIKEKLKAMGDKNVSKLMELDGSEPASHGVSELSKIVNRA